MAFLSIRNVELKGVAACVPAKVEENIALSNIPDVEKLIRQQVLNLLIEKFSIDKAAVNFAFFHQANKMMNDRIRKKLQFEEEQVPSSLKDFGNTSSASIPLTMVTQTAAQLQTGERHIIACGFGVGLSWASMYCKTKLLVIPQLLIHD